MKENRERGAVVVEAVIRSEEHTTELQSLTGISDDLVCG